MWIEKPFHSDAPTMVRVRLDDLESVEYSIADPNGDRTQDRCPNRDCSGCRWDGHKPDCWIGHAIRNGREGTR